MNFNHSFLKLYFWFLALLLPLSLIAQTNDDCLMCHEGQGLTTERNGKTISLDVNTKILKKSSHSNVTCVSCHKDAAVSEFPHPEKLAPVNCGQCHKAAQIEYHRGMHGQALALKSPHAPTCQTCHGEQHAIYPTSSPQSLTYKMNIPSLCGKCHREGSPVSKLYNIPAKNILENYSEGIHGKGLLKSGLIVTATCNNCHGNHLVLPHTSPNSSINPKRIAKTCMQCHVRIEDVHQKIIKNELWEKKPGAIPACSECHPPHKVKIEKNIAAISNQQCLKCHQKDVFKTVNGKKVSLKVDPSHLSNSVHNNIACVKCHTDVTIGITRPCETSKSVECANCHNDVANQYFASGHGQAYLSKVPNAPFCTECHGTHQIQTRYDDTSPTYRGSIPNLCGKCHTKNGKAQMSGAHLKEINAFSDYSQSVHGKGLTEKGLLASAVCTDCHTTHFILKESDVRASINPRNISLTCASCHKSIYDEYILSDHSIAKATGDKQYPTCANCHSAHIITEIDNDKFMNQITLQCGSCHKELADTYLETYHGKAYQLGYLKSARCSDCHGSHNILNVKNPNSSVGYNNIVATCKKCHSNANLKFTGYLTHATHNDNDVLFYAFWGMTSLLIGVFGLFGLHTLLWLPRALVEARKKKRVKKEAGKGKFYRRFTQSQRITHIFVIVSFLSLALTGMILKFAHMEWAKFVAMLFGGVRFAGILHRGGAIITFGYFAFHLYSLYKEKVKTGESLMQFIFGPNSLMFNKRDWEDFKATVKWFFWRGERPHYGRWTYWEKFDYLAVFWGVAIIGFSGLILWFPELFTKIFPGWMINVAQIIHSDEALLAVGFIFTIHFFNTHLRPDAFPMDTVIFTGHVPLDEYTHDRPREIQEMEEAGKLEELTFETEITPSWLKIVKIFGYIFLTTGLILVVLIIYSLLKGKY